ncbi:MAG: protein kinase, partial [Planctomycetota bacterium]
EVLAGVDAGKYLRSPTDKARVPTELRPIVDACLGYGVGRRYADCEPLLAALRAVSSPNSRSGETPPRQKSRADAPTLAGDLRGQPGRSVGPSSDQIPYAALGHYEIKEVIGRGGMGDVYRAYDPTLDRYVALKVLPPALSRNVQYIERFNCEARAIAKLSHPNIVPVHFIGSEGTTYFFAMQYVAGPSLADLLNEQKRLPVATAIRLVRQVVAGLAEAHRHGLIHRDIKPGNVLIDQRRRTAMLADFGLVKSRHDAAPMTATGVVLGTADYLSPEQGQGKHVDERSDLYSIGAVLHHVLSGSPPFAADNPTAVIFQHVYEAPPSLSDLAPDVPAELAKTVEKSLAKDPADRYQSAADLLCALEGIDAGQPSREESRSPPKHAVQSKGVSQEPNSSPTDVASPRRRLLRRGAIPAALTISIVLLATFLRRPAPPRSDGVPTAAEILTSSAWSWTQPQNLGPRINSQHNESSPWLSQDRLLLLFASDRPGGHGSEDLWISRRNSVEDEWGRPENLGPSINSTSPESSPSMSSDGLTLLFESRRGTGSHRFELYVSQRESTAHAWPPATSLGEPVNTRFNERNPYLTADGLEIYFSSNRNPSLGFNDLWKTSRATRRSPWSVPVHLGPELNSQHGDLAALPSADGTALLVSRRKPGPWNNKEIALSVRSDIDAKFGPPVAFGGPVNSYSTSCFAFLSGDGRTLWFSSQRPEGRGESDLYLCRRVLQQE